MIDAIFKAVATACALIAKASKMHDDHADLGQQFATDVAEAEAAIGFKQKDMPIDPFLGLKADQGESVVEAGRMGVSAAVGLNIKKRREELRLTQEEVAHRVGVAASYFGQIERGQRNPSINVLDDVAEALGVPLVSLFEGYIRPTRG